MMTAQKGDTFASLFKKYRLRSEIETLSQFGDLLAQEGLVYETSLFSRWQKGERVPHDRGTLLTVVKIFVHKKGINSITEANEFMIGAGQGNLTETEIQDLPGSLNEIPYKAPFASVAELLKTYRLQRNISQYEIALSLGLKSTNTIEDLERGKVEQPSRKLVGDMCRTLGLRENEMNSILLAGNYLPTKKEIENARKIAKPILKDWPYSAVLYDFSWRLILVNKNHANLLGMNSKAVRDMEQATPSAIEVVFNPEFMANKYLKNGDLTVWHNNLLRFITHFRSLHKSITKQKWYISLIKKMMKNDLFRETWKKAQMVSPNLQVTRHGYKVFFDPKTNRKYRFNVFVVPLLNDPRFEIEFYTPADKQTFNYYQK